MDFDEPGGSFSYVEHIVGPRAAGTVSWFLLLGYLFTVSLYAFTFGAYTARLLGMGEAAGPLLGAGVILLLSGLNLMGVRETGVAEDVLVVGKMVVLAAVTGVVFLAVFAVVNASALAHRTWSGGLRALPVIGLAGCLAAGGTLVLHLCTTDPASPSLVAGIAAALSYARLVYLRRRSDVPGRRG